MRKNILAVLVTVMLAGEGLCAESTPEKRMLEDLMQYVYHCEIMYADTLWALDYIGRFDRERSWESLQLARAGVEAAKRDIERLKFPALNMTAEDHMSFMKRGIDLSFLENVDSQFEAEKTALSNTFGNLRNSVMYEALYLKDDWAICMCSTENTRKTTECYLQYLANTADGVLTNLNDPAMTAEINSLLAKHYPGTHARQRKKAESPKDIEASINALLNQIEKLYMEDAKILGAKLNALNAFKYALEKKNAKWFTQNILKISNLPPLVQMPGWFVSKDIDIHYYWKEGGKVKIPSPNTKLERVPDGCKITINGVSLPQVQDYQKKLAENGLPSASKEEGGKYYAICNVNGGGFAIIWENDTVNILMDEKPVCFIPYLYLLARKNL